MSCHARTTEPPEDRDKHEDAELKKKTRGGKRMIGLHARLNSDARVFGLECHLAQLESEIRHFHGFDTAVFLQFSSKNDILRSVFCSITPACDRSVVVRDHGAFARRLRRRLPAKNASQVGEIALRAADRGAGLPRLRALCI